MYVCMYVCMYIHSFIGNNVRLGLGLGLRLSGDTAVLHVEGYDCVIRYVRNGNNFETSAASAEVFVLLSVVPVCKSFAVRERSGRNGRQRRGTSRNDQKALADPGKCDGVHSGPSKRRFACCNLCFFTADTDYDCCYDYGDEISSKRM